jgi:hypothetical protein
MLPKEKTVNTSLSHLPEYKQSQLCEITEIIVKAVDPEQVILFGSHATGRWVEHRYSREGITYEYISDYDSKPGITNYEFNYINNDPALLQKTTFIKNGAEVKWDGKTFINK